MSEKPQGGIF